jgi:hypothetical protein
MHELSIYSRRSDGEALHEFFKTVGVSRLTWATDPSTLPCAPIGFQYIPIPNDSGMAIKLNLKV